LHTVSNWVVRGLVGAGPVLLRVPGGGGGDAAGGDGPCGRPGRVGAGRARAASGRGEVCRGA